MHSYRSIPILKETPRKGVYLTFNQFKNNQPAFADFDVSLSENADAIFVKGKILQDSAIIDAWGFSDGKNTYIRVNSNFFLLLKAADNFEFYSFEEIKKHTPFATTGPEVPYSGQKYYPFNDPQMNRVNGAAGALASGIMNRITVKTREMMLLSLNPDTGKIY
jgi:hypothetical protein